MSAALTITTRGPDPDGLDFEALQRTGTALLQALCGQRWTDYNAHDPGVTMLDQLSYALTELAYRSAFRHEDYLAGRDGTIDLKRHALHLPQDVFPSEPVTADDWRRLLYDRIAEIEDVWVTQADGGNGLIDIAFKLGDPPTGARAEPTPAQAADVARRIRLCAGAERALCQDIGRIAALETEDFYLEGDIEVHSLRDPAAIYADIFFQCAHHVISGLQFDSYEHAAADGMPPDQLFSGPFTAHGHIIENEQRGADAAISLPRLIGLIRAIDGVRQVHSLGLCDANGKPAKPDGAGGKRLVPRLRFPGNELQKRLLRVHFMDQTVGSGGAGEDDTDALNALISNARINLNKLQFEARALRQRNASLEHLTEVPAGAGQPLAPYYSIQHQFPAIYGINAYGVPASAPPAAHAHARQLKAYLYVFEQVMANYLQNLAGIASVFSIDPDLNQSYFSQPLNNAMLPDIEPLYAREPDQMAQELDAIRRRLDPFEDRRERVIDVMLAMYGESYTQQALRKFNVYFPVRQTMHAWLLDNKLAFLTNIVVLLRQRAAAFRYDLPAWDSDNVSGAQRKIAILLGLHEHHCCRSLCEPMRRAGLHIVPDAQMGEDALLTVFRNVLAARPGAAFKIPATLMRKAFAPGRLDIGNASGARTTVRFRASAAPPAYWHLGELAAGEGPAELKQLSETLRALNMRCEGFHLVEHTLLRQRRADSTTFPATGEGFYPFRVSVVFPNWTARFHDPEFQKLAQETVSLNLPAHILPTFYWLDYVYMNDFETRFHSWLGKLRHATLAAQDAAEPDGSADTALDAASAYLIGFLLRHQQRDTASHWV
ncbi:hypothetical protein IV454_26040 [Massilia antarctica]|uniref:Uncharacterized protein n=1 Tax=Massilia antarctica TaxID=2765360 RepID=A0AA49A6Z7_9BURK|nr:hypothetical protein [Massilia antarctica]QPI48918.1 hypothetical protein IV454_26040 [Massilia antarctica]